MRNLYGIVNYFFSSRRRHTGLVSDWSSDVCSSDLGSASEPLMRALECGYEVILTAMSADEIISNKSATRREAVLSRFGRLLYSTKCLWPPHEIIRLLVSAHLRKPGQFGWANVDVRARPYE